MIQRTLRAFPCGAQKREKQGCPRDQDASNFELCIVNNYLQRLVLYIYTYIFHASDNMIIQYLSQKLIGNSKSFSEVWVIKCVNSSLMVRLLFGMLVNYQSGDISSAAKTLALYPHFFQNNGGSITNQNYLDKALGKNHN